MNDQFIAAKRFFNEIKKTVYLYKSLWKERTTTLLHAPREVDKTPTALAIASDVAAQGKQVLYVNSEDRLDALNADTEGLYIFTPRFESIDDKTDYADLVFNAIENAVRTTPIRTFVIDSVSRIAALSFGRNASPAYIMKRLVALQVKCELSILAVANDSTKSANNALLALSASEISLDDQVDNMVDIKPEEPVPAEVTTKPEASPKSETATQPTEIQIKVHPHPIRPSHTPMTRQMRRAMEREYRKNPNDCITATLPYDPRNFAR